LVEIDIKLQGRFKPLPQAWVESVDMARRSQARA
jgi:hypothetical protein